MKTLAISEKIEVILPKMGIMTHLVELTRHDYIYIKDNPDWVSSKKYGYVKGNRDNLVNRLNNSKEEHSELSNFTNIFAFEKTASYKLRYKEIDKIFSLICSNLKFSTIG